MSGYTKGRDRSFHFGTNEHAIVGMISHLGPQNGVADGSLYHLTRPWLKNPNVSANTFRRALSTNPSHAAQTPLPLLLRALSALRGSSPRRSRIGSSPRDGRYLA